MRRNNLNVGEVARAIGRSRMLPTERRKDKAELATVYPNGGIAWCRIIKKAVKVARSRRSRAVVKEEEEAFKQKLRNYLLSEDPRGVTHVTAEKDGQEVVVYSLNFPVTHDDFIRAALGLTED